MGTGGVTSAYFVARPLLPLKVECCLRDISGILGCLLRRKWALNRLCVLLLYGGVWKTLTLVWSGRVRIGFHLAIDLNEALLSEPQAT
jgi:hypothetical protein